jgi:hypothetical protein
MKRRVFLEGVVGSGALALAGIPRSALGAVEIDRDELLELAAALCRIPSFTTEGSDCARVYGAMIAEL